MNKEDIYSEIDNSQSFIQQYLGLSLTKFLILLLIVAGLGVYMGIVLYGDNSLEVLFELQDYENFLQEEVYRLRDENAELQKEYFELKEISAQ